jgi:hypothetical protein
VVFQPARRGFGCRCHLVGLAGEGGGVELEGRLDQRDELCGRGQHLPVDLADGLGHGQVGQVHRDQVRRLGDEVRAEPGQVGTERSRRTTGGAAGAPAVPAHARKAAAEGGGQAVRGDLALTPSHDRDATGRMLTLVAAESAAVRST